MFAALLAGASMGHQRHLDSLGKIDAGRSLFLLCPAVSPTVQTRPQQMPPPRSSPARYELTALYLPVDCLASRCKGKRTFAIAALASFYERHRKVGEVLRRMGCSGDCGGRVEPAWLLTGPVLNARVRPR